MKRFNSLLRFASKYNDDIWSKIFRFNKCVKAFKYISFSKDFEIKRRYQWTFRINSKYYFSRTKRPKNRYGSIMNDRRKVQYFYGKLSRRELRVSLFGSKGKSSYSRVDYMFSLFESRIDLLLFRTGWFSGTIETFQLAYRGLVLITDHFALTPYERVERGSFVVISKYARNTELLLRRMSSVIPKSDKKSKIASASDPRKGVVFPVPYLFVSEYLPFFIFTHRINSKELKVLPDVSLSGILKYSYLQYNFLYFLDF